MGRKQDLRRVDAVIAEFRNRGMDPEKGLAFRDYLHECKESGDYGTAGGGDYTMDELREKAREFLGLGDE